MKENPLKKLIMVDNAYFKKFGDFYKRIVLNLKPTETSKQYL